MAGEVTERKDRSATGAGRRRKRRLSVRTDLTPMVDIAFLLLIFYMVTTVFAMPQAMEINLPPSDDTVIVPESSLLSIYVDDGGRYWWNIGVSSENLPRLIPPASSTSESDPYGFNADSLRGLLVARNRENPNLNTLVLISRDASYGDLVNILDEIDVIERSWNTFKADQLGISVDELSRDNKFSYRYALGEWLPKHDKIIAAAEQAAMQRGEI